MIGSAPSLHIQRTLDSLPGTKCSLPSYSDSKIHQQRDQDQRKELERPRKELERGKAERGEKKVGEKRGPGTWRFSEQSLHSLRCFLLKKKNEKGMMEKEESDKFNDVCSKLRLEK